MSFNIPFRSVGGSISKFPPMPEPLKNEGFISSLGNITPHKGTLIDNLFIPLNFSVVNNGQIDGKLAGSIIWTVFADDINAAADGYLSESAFWYDSVNDRLYVFCLDTGTTPDTLYTAYITLETGAITNIGSGQFSTDPTAPTVIGNITISRPNIDSGDFTLICNDRTIVIDEGDGSEVSNVASENTSDGSVIVGTYTTLDGTITLDNIKQISTTNEAQISLSRNKLSSVVPIPTMNLFATTMNSVVYAMPWGDKVKIRADAGTSNSPILRTFNRTKFDEWLQLVADYGGLA